MTFKAYEWDWVKIGLIICVILFVGATFASIGLREHYRRICLDHGFGRADGTYCIKIVNGTDSVVTVNSLR